MSTYVTISPGHRLAAPAAASWARMVEDGMPTTGVRSALRTRAEQVELFLDRYRPQSTGNGPYGDVRWFDGVRYVRVSPHGSVAIPGSAQANHEDGLALDLFGDTLAWVRKNGHRYGWIIDRIPGEPWHVEYVAARDTHRNRNEKEDAPMFIMRKKRGTGWRYRLVTGTRSQIITEAAAAAFKRAGLKIATLSEADYTAIYQTMKGK